jgi:hypothetical protein
VFRLAERLALALRLSRSRLTFVRALSFARGMRPSGEGHRCLTFYFTKRSELRHSGSQPDKRASLVVAEPVRLIGHDLSEVVSWRSNLKSSGADIGSVQ